MSRERHDTEYISKQQFEPGEEPYTSGRELPDSLTPINPRNNPENPVFYDHRMDQYLTIKNTLNLQPEEVVHLNNENLDVTLEDVFNGVEVTHTSENADTLENMQQHNMTNTYTSDLDTTADLAAVFHYEGNPKEIVDDALKQDGYVMVDDYMNAAENLFEADGYSLVGVAPMEWNEGSFSSFDHKAKTLYLDSLKNSDHIAHWGDSKKSHLERLIQGFLDEEIEKLQEGVEKTLENGGLETKKRPGDIFVYHRED